MALPSPVADFPDMAPVIDQARQRANSFMQAAWVQPQVAAAQQQPTFTLPLGDQAGPAVPDPYGVSSIAQWGQGQAQTAVQQKFTPKDELGKLIIETAEAAGADPLDLATALSYESAGTFDPMIKGPVTQWGQHQGLIQFGETQARQHGVDFSSPEAALRSQLGANGGIVKYLRASGFKPGMSGLDLYSTINAGAPGRYKASDANNGGAPGSVADKWNNQMNDHRKKAAALLGLA